MKAVFKIICFGVVCFLVQMAGAQEIEQLIVSEEEGYIPREPTKEELKRYEINSTIEEVWGQIFDDPENGELHWSIAKQYNLLGNSDIAEHELARAEELEIDRSLLLSDIGRAYLNGEKYEKIFAEIFIEQAPFSDHGVIYLIFGHTYFATNDLESAFVNYYKAAQLIEDRFELNSQLATLYNLMGDYENAELNASRALGFEGTNVEMLTLKAMLVHRRAGIEQSFNYFEKAAFYRPDDTQTQMKLAGALYDLKRNDEAMVVLRKILAQDNSHAYANFMIATIFAEGNNIRTATGYLNRAGSGYDDFVPGLLLKGKLAYATRSYEQAEAALSRLIRLEPEHIEARRLLGASLINLGNYVQAARILQYIEKNNMLDGNDFLLLGNAFILAGDYDKGTQFLKSAANLELSILSEQQTEKKSQYERGENFGVSIDLTAIINQSASSNHQLILKAYDALSVHQYDVAIENAIIILEQDRRNPIGYNLLGLSYMEQGKIAESTSNFRRALEIDSGFHQARINLAKIEILSGNQNAAVLLINQILAIDESYIPAYELLYELSREQDDKIRAERYLITATSANQNLLSIREKLLNFYFEENSLARARRLAAQMVEGFPGSANSYKALGKVSILQGDMAFARDNLQQSLALNNTDEDVYMMLSKAYIGSGEILKARPLLKGGLSHVKDIFPLQIALINLAKDDGDYANSHHYVGQLKLSERTRANAFLYEGELYMQQQKTEDAILSFENARRAGANISKVNAGLVDAKSFVGQIEPVRQSSNPNEIDLDNDVQAIIHFETLLTENQSDIE
ncbi:MAG: tetratricopeptide repeat protein, partial [Kordiimonadaceae bacterium]|nr:tetratricopeptide repeat protein [Kordiimonadaceae bacterium]